MVEFPIGSRVTIGNPKIHHNYILPIDADQEFEVIATPEGRETYEIGRWLRSATGRVYCVVIYALRLTERTQQTLRLVTPPQTNANSPRIDAIKKSVVVFVIEDKQPYCGTCAIELGKTGKQAYKTFHFGITAPKCLKCRKEIA